MIMMTLAIYTHPSGLEHQTPEGHIERRERLETVLDLLREEPYSSIPVKEAPEALIDQILLAHDENYVFDLEERAPKSGIVPIDGGDTWMSPGSWTAALHGAGAVCAAVDDIMSGSLTRAFCAMRPPGHHAERNMAMGFCLFNNIFIGALHAQKAYGVRKIAIVDFDVHHGNASDNMARAHDGVFYISSHQWPLFPGSGGPDSNLNGRVLNLPLPDGTGSEDFRELYESRVFPALSDYAPDLLMISAGFDACAGDPSASLTLTPDDLGWATGRLIETTAPSTGGKTISVLEGGYNLVNLKEGVAAHLDALQNT